MCKILDTLNRLIWEKVMLKIMHEMLKLALGVGFSLNHRFVLSRVSTGQVLKPPQNLDLMNKTKKKQVEGSSTEACKEL